MTDSPALSTTSSSLPVPIVKKESNLRSWFTSSSSAAVPTNSPVNLSTSSPTASGGMGGRGGGNLLDALAGSADRPLSPVAASGDSSASSSAQSTAKTSKPFYGDFLSKTNHNQSTPQNKQQQTPQMKQEQDSQQPPPQQQQQQKSSRRTTSLLNLFMSNSQGNFFETIDLFFSTQNYFNRKKHNTFIRFSHQHNYSLFLTKYSLRQNCVLALCFALFTLSHYLQERERER